MKEIKFDSKNPLICVPLVSSNNTELCNEAIEAQKLGADILEFRCDFFDFINYNQTINVLKKIKDSCDLPLIFTFRTSREGGNREITKEDYKNLLLNAINSGQAEIVDCEYYFIKDYLRILKDAALKNDVKLIFSYHNFNETPTDTEIIKIFKDMIKSGADIPKIAVMPNDFKDVFILMEALSRIKASENIPLIGISMGKLGMVSRFMPENFGSFLTFATVSKCSAPGQMHISDMKLLIDTMHKISSEY